MAYNFLMETQPITVAETDTFIRQAAGVWTDEERSAFVDFIARNPEVGDVIQGTGGVRKVRWRRQGSGKRGGVRVIYFYLHMDAPLYLLMIYAKAHSENLSPEGKHLAQAMATRLKQANRPRAGRRTDEN